MELLSSPFRLTMKFVLKPSLEHIAVVKVVISLWNQNDVRSLIAKPNFSEQFSSERWMTIEERVKEKVTQLSLPELLKAKVFGVIKPIGLEIFKWMKYFDRYSAWYDFHSPDLDLLAHLPADLCWTPQGTVDRKRTAEVLVRDENLDILTRYCLASDYCLEDAIVRFWNKLSEDLKDYDLDYFPVISFWSHNMKRGGAGHISYKDLFYLSALLDNKVAAEYFLQKLTPQEREESFEKVAKDIDDVDDADVLCFLLAKMEKEQQRLVFRSDPCGVLQCFLQWPYQGFFIGIANCMWDFLSRENYEEILRDIISKVENDFKDYHYQKLFRECWQKSPRALKDSLTEDIDNSWLLQCLFRIKDKEIIRLILKDATPTAKTKFIYSGEIKNFCKRSIHYNEWDFLEFFIRECFPSKNEMLKFKMVFEKCMYFKEYCSATNKHKWNLMLCSSDDSICKYGKRSVEEGESSSSKRFQSLQ